jgi:putative solute:sodium symporter small subunit
MSTARREIVEGTPLGGVYVRRLRRKQLGVSLLALIAFAGLIGALPLVLYLVPSLNRVHVFGVPLSAALVTVPPFVVFVAVALLYRRRADDVDAAFSEVIDEQ